MRKFFILLTFAGTVITTGIVTSSCQTPSEKDNAKTDIQQVDTPQTTSPGDVLKEPQTDTIKNNTSNMKDDTTARKPLTINIGNLASGTAPVEISIYNPEDKFPSEKGKHKTYRFTPTSADKLAAEITDIPYGDYAVAAYQDLDADGKIAKNFVGIPTDPYGFSNNYVPKIKAPAFKDCKFAYDEKTASINFSMIRKQ